MLNSSVLDQLFGDRQAVDGSKVRSNFSRWFASSAVRDELGAPQFVYHGTRGGDFSTFKPRFRPGENLGFGIHFAMDRSFAERYALDEAVARKKGGTPHVFEVVLSMQTPLVADAIVKEGSASFDLAKKLAGRKLYISFDENKVPCVYLQNAIDATSPERAQRLIREAGYDGLFYQTRLVLFSAGCQGGSITAKSPACIVFEPCQVKRLSDNSGLFRLDDPSMDDGAASMALAHVARQSLASQLTRSRAP